MKALLISPPTNSIVKAIIGTTGPPLGLAYLASVAREEGWEVKIVDALAEDLDFEDVKKIIGKYYPDVLGLSATTSMIPDAYKVASIAKAINPDMLVMIGGPHVTFTAEQTLEECQSIDVVVRGEGEETFRELLQHLREGRGFRDILGITYRENGGEIRSNPPRPLIRDLDKVPLPAYDLLPMMKYRIGKIRFGTIMTSRGCPYNCVFCSSSLQFGKRWRSHSLDRVIEELRILVERYRVREIEFLDDTFTLNRKRAIEISNTIRKEKLDISWSASSRVNTFNREIGEAMRRAGAHTIYFGIESGSEKTLKFIGKGITLRQSIDAVRAAKGAGLRTLGSFIIGFPYEELDDMKATIRFSNRVGVDLAQFTVATPYPGTRLWEIAVKDNLLLTRDWGKFTTVDVVMRNLYLTAEQIQKLFFWAYLYFYLHPKHALQDLIKNKGFILKKTIPAVLKFIRENLGILKRSWRKHSRRLSC